MRGCLYYERPPSEETQRPPADDAPAGDREARLVIDVHCHVGFSDRRLDESLRRFSFEPRGAAGRRGYDAYFSPRMLRRAGWFFVRRWLGIDPGLRPGDDMDQRIAGINEVHWSAPSVDRLVLLAFDEYHDDEGRPCGPAARRQDRGSDLYVSNSLVRAMCATRPGRYLFGASIHPYRRGSEELLAEAADAGAVLVKWLPVHQNIRADDPRTLACLRAAARLKTAMLIHYGGESSLTPQHRPLEDVRPMLAALRRLMDQGEMPTTLIAHAATPTLRWQNSAGHQALMDGLASEFAEAPLYAEISALGALGRTVWMRRLAGRRSLHHKLVWGSDYPVPAAPRLLWRSLPAAERRRIAAYPSWVEQSLQLTRAMGFAEAVFTRAASLLRQP